MAVSGWLAGISAKRTRKSKVAARGANGLGSRFHDGAAV